MYFNRVSESFEYINWFQRRQLILDDSSNICIQFDHVGRIESIFVSVKVTDTDTINLFVSLPIIECFIFIRATTDITKNHLSEIY